MRSGGRGAESAAGVWWKRRGRADGARRCAVARCGRHAPSARPSRGGDRLWPPHPIGAKSTRPPEVSVVVALALLPIISLLSIAAAAKDTADARAIMYAAADAERAAEGAEPDSAGTA